MTETDSGPVAFVRVPAGYVATFSKWIVEAKIEKVRAERYGLHAEVSFFCGLPGVGSADGFVHWSRFNLSKTEERNSVARTLGKRTNGANVEWEEILEQICNRTQQAERRGLPAQRLCDIEEPPQSGLALPPILLGTMPVILFGDGGSAKSTWALGAALSLETRQTIMGLRPQRQMHVGYCDWEWDGWEHRKRARQILGSESSLLYVKCDRPLVDDLDRLLAIVGDEHLEYLVIDSVQLACDGAPEDAEIVGRFFRALRMLNCGSLLIAHVSKSDNPNADQKPFGSAFWHNSARSTWFVKATQEEGAHDMDIGLYNRKPPATGPRQPPLGFHIVFGDDDISITRNDVVEIPKLRDYVPLGARIKRELARGALTVYDLKQHLGVDSSDEKVSDTFARTMRRLRDRGVVREFAGADGVMRWGLAAPEEAHA